MLFCPLCECEWDGDESECCPECDNDEVEELDE